MIDSFTGQKRLNYSVFAGSMALCMWYLQTQVLVNYWSGAGGVRNKLQRQLTRKFLTLSDHDMEKYGHMAKEEFAQAIRETAPKLASQCYGGFHSAIGSSFGIIFARE